MQINCYQLKWKGKDNSSFFNPTSPRVRAFTSLRNVPCHQEPKHQTCKTIKLHPPPFYLWQILLVKVPIVYFNGTSTLISLLTVAPLLETPQESSHALATSPLHGHR